MKAERLMVRTALVGLAGHQGSRPRAVRFCKVDQVKADLLLGYPGSPGKPYF